MDDKDLTKNLNYKVSFKRKRQFCRCRWIYVEIVLYADEKVREGYFSEVE